jgi:hypothetical protein
MNTEPRLSVFADPLAGWANDDVLLDKDARQRLGAEHPGALRVLDWPELRALFKQHEAPANQQARRDRHFGLASVGAGVLGLILVAFAPLAASAGQLVGVAAVVLVAAGAALAAWQVVAARSTSRWLGSRYWTERARGLYFQVLINNLDLAARAMTEDRALAEWKMARARALDALPSAGDLAPQDMAADVADDEVWIVDDWKTPPDRPAETPQLTVLLARLRAQRFDIQIDYSSRKLGDSLPTPRRAEAGRTAAGLLTAAAVAAAGGAGLLLTLGLPTADLIVKLLIALAAAAAALALGLKAINDSLYPSGDLARLAWFNAAASQARTQFDHGDLDAKIDALRAMEALAYRELREFIASHAPGR